MTEHAFRLPFSLDLLIGEARRRAWQRRARLALAGMLLASLAGGLTLALRASGDMPSGGPLTGPLVTAHYSELGFTLRYPRAWTRVDWCWTGASISSPIGLITNAKPAPMCPGPLINGGPSFPPRGRYGPNVVTVSLWNGGLFPGEKPPWNARIGGKLAYFAPPEYGGSVLTSWVTCPAGVSREYRYVNIAAAVGLISATICGPDLAAGEAAFHRILASIRFTK